MPHAFFLTAQSKQTVIFTLISSHFTSVAQEERCSTRAAKAAGGQDDPVQKTQTLLLGLF